LPDGEEHKTNRNAYRNFEKSMKRDQPAACGSGHQHNDHKGCTCISKGAPLHPQRNEQQSDKNNGCAERSHASVEVDVGDCASRGSYCCSSDILHGDWQCST
jgi:hypothetical protein